MSPPPQLQPPSSQAEAGAKAESRHSAQDAEEVDVVIIGAGLSGLTAARTLHTSHPHLRLVVLEARDRVGGKTHSVPRTTTTTADGATTGGATAAKVEHGAAWINAVNQRRMWALVEEFGLETVVQNTEGEVVAQGFVRDEVVGRFAYGGLPPFAPAEQADIARIRDGFEALCWDDTADLRALDAMTMQDYLETQNASPLATASATVWTRAMLGVEPSQLSALFFRTYCRAGGGLLQMRSDRAGGGQHLRIRQGTQSFAQGLAARLPPGTVRLNEAVTSVSQQRSQGAEVVTRSMRGGTPTRYRAALAVVVSVPTPLYRAIDFAPALSPRKQRLATATAYGTYTKATLCFRRPFWRGGGGGGGGLCGLAQSFAGPAAVVRDTSVDADGSFSLTCFVAGEPGRAWRALPAARVREEALVAQVAVLFAGGDEDGVRAELVEVVVSEWEADEWAGYGCPCPSTRPGTLTEVGDARTSVEGCVHFIGTETAALWQGYMEGAVESGERGAREVLKALEGDRKG